MLTRLEWGEFLKVRTEERHENICITWLVLMNLNSHIKSTEVHVDNIDKI